MIMENALTSISIINALKKDKWKKGKSFFQIRIINPWNE